MTIKPNCNNEIYKNTFAVGSGGQLQLLFNDVNKTGRHYITRFCHPNL